MTSPIAGGSLKIKRKRKTLIPFGGTLDIDMETFLSSPRENLEARTKLGGKNLMPYLNRSDRAKVEA